MANVKLCFIGSEKSRTDDTELQCYHNQYNEITILLECEDYPHQQISLDISTAIKLSKCLRTEIRKAKEVCNG